MRLARGAELGLRSIQRAVMVQIVNADLEAVFGEKRSERDGRVVLAFRNEVERRAEAQIHL